MAYTYLKNNIDLPIDIISLIGEYCGVRKEWVKRNKEMLNDVFEYGNLQDIPLKMSLHMYIDIDNANIMRWHMSKTDSLMTNIECYAYHVLRCNHEIYHHYIPDMEKQERIINYLTRDYNDRYKKIKNESIELIRINHSYDSDSDSD